MGYGPTDEHDFPPTRFNDDLDVIRNETNSRRSLGRTRESLAACRRPGISFTR
jgi:hypothetical protein